VTGVQTLLFRSTIGPDRNECNALKAPESKESKALKSDETERNERLKKMTGQLTN
jgi:hypothetical protein